MREPLLRSDRFMDSRAILLEFLTVYSGRRPSGSASRYDQVEYPPPRRRRISFHDNEVGAADRRPDTCPNHDCNTRTLVICLYLVYISLLGRVNEGPKSFLPHAFFDRALVREKRVAPVFVAMQRRKREPYLCLMWCQCRTFLCQPVQHAGGV